MAMVDTQTKAIMALINRLSTAHGETYFALKEGAEAGIATLERELEEARLEITALTLVNKMRPAPQADMVPAEELAEARAEVERLKVDAERYAVLKTSHGREHDPDVAVFHLEDDCIIGGEELDWELDRFMAARKEGT
jgi:hypothetical protein